MTIIAKSNDWGLTEDLGFVHIPCGESLELTKCYHCKTKFPEKDWNYLFTIWKLLLSTLPT